MVIYANQGSLPAHTTRAKKPGHWGDLRPDAGGHRLVFHTIYTPGCASTGPSEDPPALVMRRSINVVNRPPKFKTKRPVKIAGSR